ncbi:hypothetical protein pipiens_012499 [Culex pipiens pipiens]|uniref:Uncharacterized protein n=1 Tax=Culex pipiens pipiens TaxID=38569 RepID=A0ABD1D245_CULPP
MNRILLAALILGICGGARADLGLKLTIPELVPGVTNAINRGVVELIKANATTRTIAEQDTSGVFVTLTAVVNNVTSPLNRLLGTTLSAASDKTSKSQTLFANLATLVSSTKEAINKALTASESMEWDVRASQFEGIQGNISVIASYLSQLQDGFTVLSTAVSLAENSEVPVTSENVAEFFSSSIIDTVIHALQNITRSVNNLAPIIIEITKDKTASQNAVSVTNTSITNAVRALQAPTAAFNRSLAEANGTALTNANGLQQAILALYTTITGRPQNYNGGDVTNLNAFLANFSAAVTDFSGNVSQAYQNVRENVTTFLNTSINQTAQVLLEVTKNITGRAQASDSPFGDRCAARYTAQLTQTPLQVSRAALCLQSELNSFGPVTQLNRIMLDQTRLLAGSSSAQVQARQCSQGLTECIAMHFARFHDLSRQVRDKLAINSELLARETATIQTRVESCTAAIRTDIGDNARMIWTKFENCLNSGA